MPLLSMRDEAQVAELERMLADLRRTCDDADVLEHMAEVVGVDITTNMRFEYDRDRLVVADAGTAGPRRITTRDLERMQRGIRSGEMQFLFSSPVPERAQRNRLAEFSPIRSTRRMQDSEASKLGFTNAAMDALRPRLEALISFYEQIGIADMHNARILICDGPLLLRYTSILGERAFTRRERALYVRCTQVLQRRTLLDHRLGLDATYRAAFATAVEAVGSAAFLVNRNGRIMHANTLGVAALDHEHDLAASIAAAVRGDPGQFDVHPLNERGASYGFLVVRRRCDLRQFADALAVEHGFTGRARQVFVAAAAGESTKFIAARLGIAHNTVEYHLTKVFRAVGVSSRAELQRVLTERLLETRARGSS